METQIDSKETIELPKNISLRNNKYQVRLQFNNSSTSKTFKTLKEAIEFKENSLYYYGLVKLKENSSNNTNYYFVFTHVQVK